MIRILLLAGNTLRARSYAQYLSKYASDNVEIKGLFYGFDEKQLSVPQLNIQTKSFLNQQDLFIPDFQETIENTFEKNLWSYQNIKTRDVNSGAVLKEITKHNCDIVVFAGYGGQLLKKAHFVNKTKYLHMHPGKLPLERGSTTIYYSILNKRKISVTAFYMSDKIDSGENVIYCEYAVPTTNVDIDKWYDNIIRADCLIRAIEIINENKEIEIQNTIASEEYYVIHPVLKHIALLSLKNK